MATLKSPVAWRGIRALAGKIDVYYHRHYGWTARAWPKAHNPCASAKWQARRDAMKETWELIPMLDDEQRALYTLLARDSIYTGVDLLRSVSLGATPGMPRLLPLTNWQGIEK